MSSPGGHHHHHHHTAADRVRVHLASGTDPLSSLAPATSDPIYHHSRGAVLGGPTNAPSAVAATSKAATTTTARAGGGARAAYSAAVPAAVPAAAPMAEPATAPAAVPAAAAAKVVPSAIGCAPSVLDPLSVPFPTEGRRGEGQQQQQQQQQQQHHHQQRQRQQQQAGPPPKAEPNHPEPAVEHIENPALHAALWGADDASGENGDDDEDDPLFRRRRASLPSRRRSSSSIGRAAAAAALLAEETTTGEKTTGDVVRASASDDGFEVERRRRSSSAGNAAAVHDEEEEESYPPPPLPRTVVWRIRLGLLQFPPAAAAAATEASSSSTNRPELSRGASLTKLGGMLGLGGGGSGSGEDGAGTAPKMGGKMRRRNSFSKLLGLGGADDDADADGNVGNGIGNGNGDGDDGSMEAAAGRQRRASTGSGDGIAEAADAVAAAAVTETTTTKMKRRNSFSRLLGLGGSGPDDNDDDDDRGNEGDDGGSGVAGAAGRNGNTKEEEAQRQDPDAAEKPRGPLPPVTTPIPYGGPLKDVSLPSVVRTNATFLQRQRRRYDLLAKEHYWGASLMGSIEGGGAAAIPGNDERQRQRQQEQRIVEAEEKEKWTEQQQQQQKLARQKSNNADPLSAMADLEERKKKREEQEDLEYRREKARMHLKLPERGRDGGNEGGGGGGRRRMERRDSACAGSRFTDFYSSKEVLDVIEKDLKRLPPDHVSCYHRRRRRLMSTGEEGVGDASSRSLAESINGVAGVSDNGSEVRSNDDSDDDENGSSTDDGGLKRSRKERAGLLSEVLFVYAREHQALGYRQGMHEILSYVLLALEEDLVHAEMRHVGRGAGTDGPRRDVLIDPTKLRHDCYAIFESIMTRLSPAYDTHATQAPSHGSTYGSSGHASSHSPMEIMGESILTKVRDVAGDIVLYQSVTSLGVPPQLYCTRWVRLMFAREVVGWRNVMTLWDSFFDLAAEEEEAEAHLGGGDDKVAERPSASALMGILEAAAASMILLVRDSLMAGQQQAGNSNLRGGGGYGNSVAPNNDGINVLMNYPPLKDATFLIDVLMTLVWQQRRDRRTSAPPVQKGYLRGTVNRQSAVTETAASVAKSFAAATPTRTAGALQNTATMPVASRTTDATVVATSQQTQRVRRRASWGRLRGSDTVEKDDLQQQQHQQHPLANDNPLITGMSSLLNDATGAMMGSISALSETLAPPPVPSGGPPSASTVSTARAPPRESSDEVNLGATPDALSGAPVPENAAPGRRTSPPESRVSHAADSRPRAATAEAGSTTAASASKPKHIDNEELANVLGRSVATIMHYLKNKSSNSSDDAAKMKTDVPHEVWEALLDINNVGKALMADEK